VVLLVDLHRGVRARGSWPTDQQRDVEALPLHLGREVDHLVQRRRDQPGQPDDVGVVFLGRVQHLLRGHHDAQVDDVVVVALQHDPDDVLPMSCTSPLTVAMTTVPLLRPASSGRLARLDERDEVSHGFLHDARDFTTCGRNILPAPNRSPTTFMPAISGPSITSMGCPPRASMSARSSSCRTQRTRRCPSQRVGDALVDR